MIKWITNSVFLIFVLGIISCREKEEPMPDFVEPDKDSTEFSLELPPHFDPLPSVESNPFSKNKIELGRMLFYDPVLSGNNQVSCASCHQQNIAFTDGLALSNRGVSGNTILRHSPALINLAWMEGLFWEGGAKNLESLSLGPIGHPDEMAQSVPKLVEELNAIPPYREKFKEAFGVEEIELLHILQSLAQFQRTLISGDSRYDKYILGKEGGDLNSLELKGMSLFEEKCQSCHSGVLFTDNNFHNNGIDSVWTDISHEYLFTGRFRITFDSADLGKYKTPTLRNIAITAPYMHDGRFESLEEVLNHYQSEVKVSETLDPLLLEDEAKPGIAMSEEDKTAIIAFLNTLTDHSFLNNPDFSAPE